MAEHAHTQVALPLCAACCKPITFYAHQAYSTQGGMRFWHPECCPDCAPQREAVPA